MSAVLSADDGGLHCRVHPSNSPDRLVYLPGLHGDWTLLGPFREALADRVGLIEFSYPREVAWQLDDYASAVTVELARHGIDEGWILGESFSSQVALAIVRQWIRALENPLSRSTDSAVRTRRSFRPLGIVFVGGFVKHPMPWGVRLAQRLSRFIPMRLLAKLCRAYARMAARRGGLTRSCAAELKLFADRRSNEIDRCAITSRYSLIRDDDLRPTAREMRLPLYCLTGAIDPIVPWPLTMRWIRRQCPGFRGGQVIWRAGHNVLLDAPHESARTIVKWIRECRGAAS